MSENKGPRPKSYVTPPSSAGDSRAGAAPIGALSAAEVAAHLERARAAFRGGHDGEVEKILESLTAAPSTPGRTTSAELDLDASALKSGAFALLGRLRSRQGDDEAAEAAFRSAVETYREPQNPRLRGRLLADRGISLYRLGGRDEEAAESLQRALDAGELEVTTLRYLAWARLRLGMHDEAEAALRRAQGVDPRDHRIHEALADCLAASGKSDEAVEAYLDLALAQAAEQQPDAALAAYGKLLALQPEGSVPHVRFGDALRQTGRLEEALEAVERGLAAEPKDPSGLAIRGEILRGWSRYDEALASLSEAVELAPDYAFALASRGAALNGLGRWDEAIVDLDRALELAPEYPFALAQKAMALADSGKSDEALAAVDKALEIEPDYPLAWYLKGLGLAAAGDQQGAVEAFRRSIDTQESSAALARMGDSLRQLQRYDDALAALDRALELTPEDAYALGTKGQVLASLERRQEAVEWLGKAAELDDSQAWIFQDLGENLRRVGRFEEALTALDRALELLPDNAYVVGTRGQVLAALGRREEGIEELQKALELNRDVEWVQQELAEQLRLTGRLEESMAVLEGILARDPDNAWALGTRGQVLADQGSFEEALDALGRALAEDPDLRWAEQSRAEVLRLLERFEEALAAVDQVLEKSPGNLESLGTKGEILRVLGRNEEAVEVLERALAIDSTYVFGLGSYGAAMRAVSRYEGALAALERALELRPDYAFALEIQGYLYADGGAYRRAEELLRRATELSPAAAWAHAFRAHATLFLGREEVEQAFPAIERALELEPDEEVFYSLRGDLYRHLGEYEKAFEDYGWVIENVDPQEADSYQLARLGWCHLALGEAEQAIGYLRDVASPGGEMTYAQFDLALALLCAGHESVALVEYDRGRDLCRERHRWRQRGLFRVALRDLEVVAAERRGEFEAGVVEEVAAKLRAGFESVPGDLLEVGDVAAGEPEG